MYNQTFTNFRLDFTQKKKEEKKKKGKMFLKSATNEAYTVAGQHNHDSELLSSEAQIQKLNHRTISIQRRESMIDK